MSLLIQLRQRIKAIQTIKKVTHAMRLISMSNHTKLKGKEKALKAYKHAVHELFSNVEATAATLSKTSRTVLAPTAQEDSKPLLILVGSQRGLCGIFNTALFHFFETTLSQKRWKKPLLIAIGKKAVDYLSVKGKQFGTLVGTYDNITIGNHLVLAQQLTDMIMQQEEPYTSVTVFSNELKSFFLQKPTLTKLLPLHNDQNNQKKKQEKHKQSAVSADLEDYIWEQSPDQIVYFLAQQYFEVSLQYLLFQSLLSEHAARFFSMDNATRNAESLLETTTMDYNKLRQTKITKELTELAGSFQLE